ncbi:choice-of-anchor C family protein [Aquimonas voraii]|nr:choice-of-anchor C family protein [Aquimonas voraii]
MAAPFTNGSFEQGPDTGATFVTLTAGSTSITGWTITAGDMDYIGPLWGAGEGNRSLDLVGCLQGAISQTFDTLPGARYRVSFLMAGNPGTQPTLKTLRASAGLAAQDFSFDTSGRSVTDMGWSPRSFEFIASGASTTLSFTNTSSPSGCGGAALDAVSVSMLGSSRTAVVPVDGAPWLWLLVFGLVGIAGWRMRAQGG